MSSVLDGLICPSLLLMVKGPSLFVNPVAGVEFLTLWGESLVSDCGGDRDEVLVEEVLAAEVPPVEWFDSSSFSFSSAFANNSNRANININIYIHI